ncbi:GAF domain-containing protein [Flaviaesturariibacter aridisoli]|nr:GAF domain-containing protein [Flaviaesturariibacter aridisoli]
MPPPVVSVILEEARHMHERGVLPHIILAHLAEAAELLAPAGDAVSSILILDKEGLLRNGASPKLPYDYLTAIDGLKPNANVGTCAAVAATGEMIVTPDFHSDNKWAELRHLPLALGFVAAWSYPIKDAKGAVLGTFGTYFRTPRAPLPGEVEGVKAFAQLAAEVLQA